MPTATLPRPTQPETPPTPATENPRPKFPRDEAGFFDELKKRVGEYFARTGKSERDSWRMYLKTAIIIAWAATAYGLLLLAPLTWWAAIPVAVALAFAVAAAAFNIQHDGGHNAYSDRNWVNRLAAYSIDLIGASSYLWRWKHVVFHHTYANVDGQDTDIDPGAVARLSPHQPRRRFHRWQHLYLWPLYALTASRWHLYGDFKEVVTGYMGPHRIPRPRGWDLVGFLFGKAASIGLMLVVPMFFHEWWLVVLFYLFITCVVGVFVTVVFQLAHCVGEADFPLPAADTNRLADSWAVHQVQTTVDFGRNSRVLCWMLGGLNFQIVHHLFPRVCHVHYPALSRIIEDVCREHGVRYVAHTSFVAGLVSHYRWLKKLGRPEPAVPATAA